MEVSGDRCRYFESLFSPYIAGDLDGHDRRALADHLQGCEDCAERFGQSWRKATARLSEKQQQTSRRGRRSSSGLWLLAIVCLAGVAALGAMGLLDEGESGSGLDIFQAKKRRQYDEEVARMIAVQTELLKAVVEPLRGGNNHVSHAARGEARDFVEALRALERDKQKQPAADWLGRVNATLHTSFRATEPGRGGKDWDREAFLGELHANGLPRVVLVEVVAAYRDVNFVRVTWGDRPAFAWLLRKESDEGTEPAEGTPSHVLAYLVFADA